MSRKRKSTKKEKRSRKSARKMKYADFFDPPDGELSANLGSGGESQEENENESDEQEEFDEDAEKEGEDGNGSANSEDGDDSDSEQKSKPVSNFEKKQQKVNRFVTMITNFSSQALQKCKGVATILLTTTHCQSTTIYMYNRIDTE